MSGDDEKLDREIDRDEFKTNVLRLAHDIYLRGLHLGQEGLTPRVSPTVAVEAAAVLVMAASDDASLAKTTARIASRHGYRDPLADT